MPFKNRIRLPFYLRQPQFPHDLDQFRLADGTTKKLKVVGIVQDASTGADDFLAPPFAFTVMDTLQTLRQPELFNRVYLTVSESRVDGAPMMKRIQPRARGSAYPIKRRYCHIIVSVASEETK